MIMNRAPPHALSQNFTLLAHPTPCDPKKTLKPFSNLIIFDPTLGLLSVLGGLLGDAMAEKRSRLEMWRVRECVALCVKMVASATRIRGQAMDDVQVKLGCIKLV